MTGVRNWLVRALTAGALLFCVGGSAWWYAEKYATPGKVEVAGSSAQGKGAGGISGSADTGRGARSGGSNGPVTVEVAAARAAKSSNDIRAIGSLQSDESVQIAPEISGRVSEIVFEEGKAVKKGAVLLKLDEALAAAEVADASARLTLASANNDRARALSRTGNVTGRGRDEATANFETAEAAAALAKTRLSKHVLLAPFDGIAGVRNVSVGAFVNAGTAITNFEKIDVLKVDFKVPEIYLDAIRTGQGIEITVDAVPGQTFDATIYAINPMIDVNGRALQIRARMDNKDARLRPGLFARINIKGLTQRDVVMIPESAVLPKGGETFVFLVEQGKAVERRVKLGQRVNAEVEILEGLNAQASVVTAGQQKLREGAQVEPVPSGADAAKSGGGMMEPASATGRSG